MENKKYIFYLGEPQKIILSDENLDNNYNLSIWRPKVYKIAPKGAARPFVLLCFIWWIFHYFRIFANSNYCIFVIYHIKTGKMAHYSVVSPRYFRTSFMGKNDIQIGPIGTDDVHRRKGLANYAIQKIIEFYRNKDINFWYLAREENIASRKCIENFGFIMYGEGIKKGLFKKFSIEKKY